MDCRAFQRNLDDYLEGELDFPARFGMERHAGQCFSCEKSVSNTLALRQMAHGLQRVGAPGDFERTLLAKIQTEKANRRLGRLRDWWFFNAGGFSWRVTSVTALVTIFVVGSLTYLYFGASVRQGEVSRSVRLSTSSGVGNQESPEFVAAASAIRIGLGNLGSAISEDAVLNMLRSGALGANNWAKPFADPSDDAFVEVPIPVSGDRQLILRLPTTIRMRYAPGSQEYFIRTVSH